METLTLNAPSRIYRSYSESQTNDSINIMNKRCPDYALYWGIQSNLPHWPKGHNFLRGYNNIDIKTEKQYPILRDILEERLITNNYQPLIFIELHNILADYDEGFKDFLYKIPQHMLGEHGQLNQHIPEIYKNLDWTPNGEELWNSLKKYNPIILTSVGAYPYTLQTKSDMLDWVKTHLGPQTRVISAQDQDKKKYSISNSLIIDKSNDKLFKEGWEKKSGSKYIHYTPRTDVETIVKIVEEHISEYSL